MIYHIQMATCNILNCKNPIAPYFRCAECGFKMCDTCAHNLDIGKEICPKCTFGGNFEGIFPGISKVRFTQDHGTSILSTQEGHYSALDDNPQPIYKYAVYMTRKRNNLILVFRLQDGQGERFMKFSLFIRLGVTMIRLHSPLNIRGKKYEEKYSYQSLGDTFKQNVNPLLSSLTPKFKEVVFDTFQKDFDTFQKDSIEANFNTDQPIFGVKWWESITDQPIFGVKWWKSMVGEFDESQAYIQFDASASAASPFRPRRRGSKSVKRRRKLGSKSRSRKRSSKPRPRRR